MFSFANRPMVVTSWQVFNTMNLFFKKRMKLTGRTALECIDGVQTISERNAELQSLYLNTMYLQ